MGIKTSVWAIDYDDVRFWSSDGRLSCRALREKVLVNSLANLILHIVAAPDEFDLYSLQPCLGIERHHQYAHMQAKCWPVRNSLWESARGQIDARLGNELSPLASRDDINAISERSRTNSKGTDADTVFEGSHNIVNDSWAVVVECRHSPEFLYELVVPR
ncbi:hypothetical protein BGW36DRAFT_377404 [Talaromyces proteolyticus]|uniref:Uncharacterized protein n=1 Tax=Talaromyces proteolyticus TaxID=1131652 RepID=A0AAD4KTZ9_9EURO|nr:uncharacterized protein BGW36DRAFT_377404 [Talaromyces proteolyticus]KAH8699173.1 hypothetical protein BGW36DRAFT_377404 [Talaromyces proteolyticus]